MGIYSIDAPQFRERARVPHRRTVRGFIPDVAVRWGAGGEPTAQGFSLRQMDFLTTGDVVRIAAHVSLTESAGFISAKVAKVVKVDAANHLVLLKAEMRFAA